MVSHSSHTNHEFIILVIQVNNFSSAIESFVTFYNCRLSKILVSFSFFNMANLFQIKLREVLQKTGRKKVTKILKNTRKGLWTCEVAGLILYFQNLFEQLISKQVAAS